MPDVALLFIGFAVGLALGFALWGRAPEIRDRY